MPSTRLRDLWRATPFRLTLLNGLVFAVALFALIGLIYWRTSSYMSQRMDFIIAGEAHKLTVGGAEGLPERVRDLVAHDVRGVEYVGLFSVDHVWIAGNIRELPANLSVDGRTHEFTHPGFLPGARALAERLPWGEILIVSYNAEVLTNLRAILLGTLPMTGALILVLGLSAAAAFSLAPLRRIRALQDTTRAALRGKLGVRLPLSPRRDELDMLAGLANSMMDETERLLWEAKNVGDNVAHDLRTPLTRLRGLLYRVQQEGRLAPADRAMVDQAVEETDALLTRFRALLRIGEIERRDRQANFEQASLAPLMAQAYDLYEPLAEEKGLTLSVEAAPDAPTITCDPTLVFEALSNLTDNAIKFSPPGGQVSLRLTARSDGVRIEVTDKGPGIPAGERDAVVSRFYRGKAASGAPGSGLGLSIVSAVARLHHFGLRLEDAGPGLRVVLECWPHEIAVVS